MSLLDQLNALFLEQLSIEVPDPDTDLIESGTLDSMKLVELLVQIEQHFGLRVELEQIEIDDLRTVRGIARMIGNAAPVVAGNAMPVMTANAARGTIENDAEPGMIEAAAPIAAAG